jgi:hypothetical protein
MASQDRYRYHQITPSTRRIADASKPVPAPVFEVLTNNSAGHFRVSVYALSGRTAARVFEFLPGLQLRRRARLVCSHAHLRSVILNPITRVFQTHGVALPPYSCTVHNFIGSEASRTVPE